MAHENPKWGNSLVFESDIHSASSSMIVTLENRVRGQDVVDWALKPLCTSLRQWIASAREDEENCWYDELHRPDAESSPNLASFTPFEEECGLVACDYMVSKGRGQGEKLPTCHDFHNDKNFNTDVSSSVTTTIFSHLLQHEAGGRVEVVWFGSAVIWKIRPFNTFNSTPTTHCPNRGRVVRTMCCRSAVLV